MKLNRAAITVPEHYSLLTLSSVGCALSVLKKAEDRPELIVRLYNPSATEASDTQITFNQHQVKSVETGMDERPLAGAEGDDICHESVRFRPCQSRTFSIARVK
jgi:Alpha-mannosidase